VSTDIPREAVRARIAVLEEARDSLRAEADLDCQFYNARIEELEELLAGPRDPGEDDDAGDGGDMAEDAAIPATIETIMGQRVNPFLRLRQARSDDSHRVRVAKYLLANGPVRMRYIANALDISHGSIFGILEHPWFARTGPARRDPWGLSPAGKEAMKENPPTGRGAD
jgi:hypothetical protein